MIPNVLSNLCCMFQTFQGSYKNRTSSDSSISVTIPFRSQNLWTKVRTLLTALEPPSKTWVTPSICCIWGRPSKSRRGWLNSSIARMSHHRLRPNLANVCPWKSFFAIWMLFVVNTCDNWGWWQSWSFSIYSDDLNRF